MVIYVIGAVITLVLCLISLRIPNFWDEYSTDTEITYGIVIMMMAWPLLMPIMLVRFLVGLIKPERKS